MAFTATVETAYQNVMLSYTAPASAATLTISRTGPSGTPAVVRGWSDSPIAGGSTVTARDYEAPIGVPLTYTAEAKDVNGAPVGATVNCILNPSGEINTVGWTPRAQNNADFNVSTEQAHFGASSFKLIRDTDATGPQSIYMLTPSGYRPVVAAGQYVAVRASCRAATTGRPWLIQLLWMDVAGVQVGSLVSGPSVNDDATAWADMTVSAGPAPAGTATVQVRISSGVAIPEGEAHYLDAITASVSGTSFGAVPAYADGDQPGYGWSGAAHASTTVDLSETATVTVPSQGCSDTWLNDLARVGNTLHITLEQIPELAYPVPNTVHEVITRRAPIVTSDVAHTAQLEVSILTESDDERERARALLGNGMPVLLRTPPEDGIGNMYLSVLDFKEQRVVTLGTVTDRRFVISARHVARPDPTLYVPSAAVLYDDVRDSYATYTELRAQRATYDALLYGWTGAAPSDIVPWPPDDV